MYRVLRRNEIRVQECIGYCVEMKFECKNVSGIA
jgi:hypothetical protein